MVGGYIGAASEVKRVVSRSDRDCFVVRVLKVEVASEVVIGGFVVCGGTHFFVPWMILFSLQVC